MVLKGRRNEQKRDVLMGSSIANGLPYTQKTDMQKEMR